MQLWFTKSRARMLANCTMIMVPAEDITILGEVTRNHDTVRLPGSGRVGQPLL
jgi:hypothetical protein